jgi:hypothetical protein
VNQYPSVMMFDRGSGVKKYILDILSPKEVTETRDVQNILSGACEVVVCDGLFTAVSSLSAGCALVGKLAARYRLVVLFEPVAVRQQSLFEVKKRSFHEGFASNRFSAEVNPQLLLEEGQFQQVDQFGCNPAYDSSASWIVPLDYPYETFPSSNIADKVVAFEETPFEYSCFVCSPYNAVKFDAVSPLQLLQRVVSSSPWRLAKAAHRPWLRLCDTGAKVYATPETTTTAQQGNDTAAPFKMHVRALQHSIITGAGSVFSKDGFIAESDYLLPHLLGPHGRQIGMKKPNIRRNIDGITVAAINIVTSNYYHWVAQAMPLIVVAHAILVCRGRNERVTVVTTHQQPFHRPMLDAVFGDSGYDVVFLKNGEYVTADTILYSDVLGGRSPAASVTEQVAMATLLRERLVVDAKPPYRRIYISRLDTSARRMANEDRLIQALTELEFEIITLSSMSVSDQIRAFSEARVVVGPHGAGLANILFSRPGTRLLELRQETYQNDCMRVLAQTSGVHWSAYTSTGGADKHGWFADVDHVVAIAKDL